MGLLDLMNDVKNDGFDPEKDKATVSTNTVWPDGEYTVMIGKLTGYRQNQFFGNDEINIQLEQVEGDLAGSQDFHTLSLETTKSDGSPLPSAVVRKNTVGTPKEIMQILAVTDTEYTDDDWEDLRTIGERLEDAVGKMLTVEFSSKPNKKNPDYPYKNYNFVRYEQGDMETPNPFAANGNTEIDISDDDLPF
ncbi:hypothetical protein [Leuconostoc citreum]|uniref:hypothetical protein n=1 Tax=Leuconostoc citreum TaxID=33964 RepID=UPI001C1F60E1|nr:hypothetical protein [Leuconostoc citreum]MBU7450686.1 hypothetical protein [Leuconostoc citreum]MCT3075317.1 hypothetical protein [Leuconostoc citreum]